MDKYTVIHEGFIAKLSFFPGFNNIRHDALPKYMNNLNDRLKLISDGVFFNPIFLAEPQMKRDSIYTLNISEILQHTEPYVHKIFVIYRTCLDNGSRVLVYARSSFPKEKDTDETVTSAEDMSTGITQVLEQLTPHLRKNVVAIVSDSCIRKLAAIGKMCKVLSFKPPPLVYDKSDLYTTFAKEYDIFCCGMVDHIMSTTFKKDANIGQQMSEIRAACASVNMKTLPIYWAFVEAIKLTVENILQIKDEAELFYLNNRWMDLIANSIAGIMPVLTLEDCAKGGGLVSYIVYDSIQKS